ncbi:unnamed protein product [Malus baccata var. baccata]
MSSLRNAVSRRAHKERAQPESKIKFGLLEKHKDYVERAKAYHKKEETLRKAFFRNPDEFNFKMTKTRTVDGVHKLESRANKYTPEELLLMKTQDIGYIFQIVQSEKKKTEKLTVTLHSLDNWPSSRYVYFAEDRKEAREIQSRPKSGKMPVSEDIPDPRYCCFVCLILLYSMCRKTAGSYRELEGRRKRVNELEKIYMDMAMQKELQKKGKNPQTM